MCILPIFPYVKKSFRRKKTKLSMNSLHGYGNTTIYQARTKARQGRTIRLLCLVRIL